MQYVRPEFVRLLVALGAIILLGQAASAEDRILDVSMQEKLGFEETPVVRVEVEVDSQRDLHVAFQQAPSWQGVKNTKRRIKQSGKYHFEVPFDNLRPGNYRISVYLTPRRKDWNDRLGNPTFFQFEVIDQPNFEARTAFSSRDQVQFIGWPQEVGGTEEVTLEVRFALTEPRDLIVRLANSDNWEQMGELIFPVKEPGNITIPLANLTSDFPPGNYAWIVWITESGTTEPAIAKLGKHFVLTE